MPKIKKLLFVEDYEDDYLLLLKQLKTLGLSFTSKRIFKKDDLKAALAESWDAIICDHNLPGFTALDALHIVRESDTDLPFIIVSGFITEEEAATAMKEGASDYIIKGDYNRFLPALEREVRDYKIKLKKKEIEGELIKKEEAFKLLTENAQDLLLLSDINGKILYISNSVKRITGYAPEEVLGQNISKFITKKDNEKYLNILSQIKEGTIRTFKSTYEVLKADGSSVFLDNILKPYFDSEGNIKIVSTSRDLTDRIVYEKKITESQQKLYIAAREIQQLIDYANFPIFGFDLSGKINEWNQAAKEISGYSKEEVLGKKNIQQLIPKDFKHLLIQIFKNAFKEKDSSKYELEILSKSGEKKIILFSSTARMNHEGELTGVFCFGQDFTQESLYRNQLEEKVKERTEQLTNSLKKERELLLMRSRFISMASHEFKTPLSTISFAAEYIERYFDRITKEKILARIKKVKEQVHNMEYLLNEVLEFGKVEAGKIQSNKKDINLLEFINSLAEDLKKRRDFSHEIIVEAVIPENMKVFTDHVLLNNICSNFLTNAMKYSPGEKQVIWQISMEKGCIVFAFQDFGIGIPKEDQDKIFEAFYRATNTNEIEGTGLGLSIALRSAEALGGTIKLVESSSLGTTFEFRLPLT